jgi:hypothetical protein
VVKEEVRADLLHAVIWDASYYMPWQLLEPCISVTPAACLYSPPSSACDTKAGMP